VGETSFGQGFIHCLLIATNSPNRSAQLTSGVHGASPDYACASLTNLVEKGDRCVHLSVYYPCVSFGVGSIRVRLGDSGEQRGSTNFDPDQILRQPNCKSLPSLRIYSAGRHRVTPVRTTRQAPPAWNSFFYFGWRLHITRNSRC
jgi:hypothetical protein